MGMTDIERRALKGGTAIPFVSSIPGVDELPIRVPREDAAALLTKYFFRTSARTLERAPLTWQLLNGKAHRRTADLFAWAESLVAEAPHIRGGKRPASQQQAA
jgi:hypothetical protein